MSDLNGRESFVDRFFGARQDDRTQIDAAEDGRQSATGGFEVAVVRVSLSGHPDRFTFPAGREHGRRRAGERGRPDEPADEQADTDAEGQSDEGEEESSD